MRFACAIYSKSRRPHSALVREQDLGIPDDLAGGEIGLLKPVHGLADAPAAWYVFGFPSKVLQQNLEATWELQAGRDPFVCYHFHLDETATQGTLALHVDDLWLVEKWLRSFRSCQKKMSATCKKNLPVWTSYIKWVRASFFWYSADAAKGWPSRLE